MNNKIWENIRLLKISLFALPERPLDPNFLEKPVDLDGKLLVKLKVESARPTIVELLEKNGYLVTEAGGNPELIIEKKK